MATYWLWWIASALLVGAELLTGTFYLLAVGVAVAFGGVAAWLGASIPIQWAVAGVLGVALTISAHRWRMARALPPPQPPFDVGQTVRVQSWKAASASLSVADRKVTRPTSLSQACSGPMPG